MKRDTIKKHSDFFTSPEHPSARNDIFILKTKPAKNLGMGRFGVVATKKMFKLAVDRNRAKRLLRDWIGFYERFMLPDIDYIFIARPGILGVDRHTGRKNMRNTLQKIAKMYKTNEDAK